mgnify:CR=1 FL=1
MKTRALIAAVVLVFAVGAAFLLSSVFALGILTTIGCIGAVTAAVGRMMGDVGPYGNYVVAVLSFVVGLYLMEIIPLPWSGSAQTPIRRSLFYLHGPIEYESSQVFIPRGCGHQFKYHPTILLYCTERK